MLRDRRGVVSGSCHLVFNICASRTNGSKRYVMLIMDSSMEYGYAMPLFSVAEVSFCAKFPFHFFLRPLSQFARPIHFCLVLMSDSMLAIALACGI